MRNYTKKGTNAENFMQISLLLKKIWYLKDSRNGHFAMHYSSFLIFFNFLKCASQIFIKSGNINHQNGSETCPKSTKNSQTKGFPESDTTLFRPNFDVTAYVSEKQKCRRKKYRKIFLTVRLVSA